MEYNVLYFVQVNIKVNYEVRDLQNQENIRFQISTMDNAVTDVKWAIVYYHVLKSDL